MILLSIAASDEQQNGGPMAVETFYNGVSPHRARLAFRPTTPGHQTPTDVLWLTALELRAVATILEHVSREMERREL